jgi:hypothetical protein
MSLLAAFIASTEALSQGGAEVLLVKLMSFGPSDVAIKSSKHFLP